MVESLFLIFVLSLIVFIIVKTYFSESKDPILKKLKRHYHDNSDEKAVGGETEIFYYWDEGKSKNYINGMYVHSNEKGIYIKPTIFNFWLKNLYIPWSELQWKGEFRSYLAKKDVYFLCDIGVYIGVSRKHKCNKKGQIQIK
ncbi:hypothetical protein [Lacimicrobium alkaliphilum]|uniref:Uncharacterized protein n=1 Tax=Lacimicrobium alkaliphilum TaxID=1526571 RepID=A0A0U3B3D7_9ALTE|nr:hypothetical protein [Lacimicrobium alkaliphilum]ALS99736.1 hypothetical protein AT746_16660 [Lacimicrobium alkaliphilum]